MYCWRRSHGLVVSGHLQRQWTRVDSQLFTNVFLSLLVCKMWYRKNLAPAILKLFSFSAFELKEIKPGAMTGLSPGPKNFYVNWGGGCVDGPSASRRSGFESSHLFWFRVGKRLPCLTFWRNKVVFQKFISVMTLPSLFSLHVSTFNGIFLGQGKSHNEKIPN